MAVSSQIVVALRTSLAGFSEPRATGMPTGPALLARIVLLVVLGWAGAGRGMLAQGAELPLGTIEQANAKQVVVHFDPGVRLLPGSMLAVYGPGRVEKHPLTHEVIIEHRVLVAKLQLLASPGPDGKVLTRPTWSDGTALLPGFDSVPLPGEAAPNAPPALTGPLPVISAAAESTVAISLPIADPDGDALTFSWSMRGPPGETGVLDVRTTTQPVAHWTAPGKPGPCQVHVVARDPLGQQCEVDVTLTALALDDVRGRELKPFATVGGDSQLPLSRLYRDAQGWWWGIDESDGQVQRCTAGWMSRVPFPFASEHAPQRPMAVRVWHGNLYVLDGKEQAVLVFGPDGSPKGQIGQFQAATDLAIASDGTLFVADQASGGVLVFEANGQLRGRLGRAGAGTDGFVGLVRLTLGPAGELYCLDAAQGQIERFDRFQRRLDTWSVQLDPHNPPLDLAMHAKGLLVLLADGGLLVIDGKGLAGQAWKSLGEAQLVDRAGAASGVCVDGGEVYVTYTQRRLIARYGSDGAITGVRGAGLWEFPCYAADGQGRIFALDTDSGYVYQYDGEGFRTARLGGLEKNGGSLRKPIALAVDPRGTGLAVLDGDLRAVVRFDLRSAGKPVIFGQPGKNNGQFEEPRAIAMDSAGRAYVLDYRLHRVQVFDANGSFLYQFGHYDRGKQADELSEPTQVAVNLDGTAAYVYDDDNEEIKKYALDPQANSASHVNNTGGDGSGPGQFRSVKGMGCDRLGLLYVADSRRGDLQIIDFRGSNAVIALAHSASDLNIRHIEHVALAPDGQFYAFYDGTGVGWRW